MLCFWSMNAEVVPLVSTVGSGPALIVLTRSIVWLVNAPRRGVTSKVK